MVIEIHSRCSGFKKKLHFFVIPQISSIAPQMQIAREKLNIPKNIALADPQFHNPASIDILLGVSTFLSILSIGQIKLSVENKHEIILQKTLLGWIVGGSVNVSVNHLKCHHINIKENIQKFWENEDIPSKRNFSDIEKTCEEHFMKNTRRDNKGRYVVALPFNTRINQLGQSRMTALNRLLSLERRFQRDPQTKQLYTEVIQEYINLGHMQKIENPDDTGFYLPHHAVYKESSNTTKLRVVFNGSAASSTGISLNQALHVGPTIQDDLFTHLLRFRLHNYVLTGDIEKMYRQVMVREEDRKFQKILWKGENGMVETYQLNTVTFGLGSAPYLAIRTVHQLADDDGSGFPLAARALKQDLYVDDLLSGASTIEDAIKLRDQSIELLNRGGFNLRQCASNVKEILTGLPDTKINLNLKEQDDYTLKTLGIFWDSNHDSIRYTVRPWIDNQRITKRTIASEVAKIFDPLGLVNPVIIPAKLIMQSLWNLDIDWDESIPMDIYTQWTTFASQLPHLNQIKFDRHLLHEKPHIIEIHGFCDASKSAYGACIYIKSIDKNGDSLVNLYCSKSRVAPLKKPQTIPRYELCAALLLSRLYEVLRSAISLKIDRVTLWTDSTIVLHWIHTPAHLLKPFIANRITKILETTNKTDWRHVRSHDNPADILSRGETTVLLCKSELWKHGPSWLMHNDDQWPTIQLSFPDEAPEMKKITCLKTERLDDSIFHRFSSFTKLQRVVAYCLRLRKSNIYSGVLTVEELNSAHDRIIFLVQRMTFDKEILVWSQKQYISTSKLKHLTPFIDSKGLIRVGGRLKNSIASIDKKHPVLLPRSHIITKLIIQHAHEITLHSGIQGTLSQIRQRYWPIDGKNQVRFVIHKCIRCIRCKPSTINYKMGDLPAIWIMSARPFLNSGVDYCGPFFIKEKKFRNRTKIKVYIAIFICLTTKAVHIELVSDLTTDGFIAALRRFVSRRGRCMNIYSDNGLNFVGANNELKKIIETLHTQSQDQLFTDWLLLNNIKWHFNPPYSPHTGGIWEAAVKSCKHHLTRVMGNELFTFEQLTTLLTEIEAILNSRPLIPLSSDPNDFQTLTPAHFLIGDSLTNLPDHDYINVSTNRLSVWQHIQQLKQSFWKRWYKEYLSELNVRYKWSTGEHPIRENCVVIIRDDNLPPLHWRLGRVQEVKPGSDGIIRVVKIKTQRGLIERNVKYLCPLLVDEPALSSQPESS